LLVFIAGFFYFRVKILQNNASKTETNTAVEFPFTWS
jgi:hypothetical protein